ncbi:hypothetical protein KC318_g3840 [Hortaea werneckii]|nr:hypothetical protein KC334_g4041 [Hortaea werneckii]KAI7670804.1 hypothetical protein KC318_g3840 [Hortaea werneckii]
MVQDPFKPARRVAGQRQDVWSIVNEAAGAYNQEHGAGSVVNMGQGFFGYNPPEFVLNAAKDALDKVECNQYSPTKGRPRLKKAIADAYSPFFGKQIDPETEVTITTGANEGMLSAFMGFLEPGDEVIVFEPFFDQYISNIEMPGGKVVYVPLHPPKDGATKTTSAGDWTLDMKELESKITDKTRMMVINTPHNPVGKVFSREELQAIGDLCVKHNIIILSDEVYDRLYYVPFTRPSTLSPEIANLTLTVGSGGKCFYCTGWRVGYLIGPEHLIKYVSAAHTRICFSSVSPLQEATAVAFEQAEQHNFWEESKKGMKAKMDKFNEVWEELGLPYSDPEGGYFVLVNFAKVKLPEDYEFPPHVASRPRDFKLSWFFIKELGIAAIPPTEFFTDANAHIVEDWLRFAVCKDDEVLEKAKERLRGLKKYRGDRQQDAFKMQDLATLPRDIKHYILQFLTDPRDFYNLNLTCQELRHDALPFYYNTVHVNGNVALPVLAAGLVPTNPGLQQLRHLVIKEPYRDDPIECQCQHCPMHSNTDTALTLLANLLPYDRLLTFTCDCVLPLPSLILATLYRRQPKLRTLRLDSFHLDPVIASLSQGRLANIATVYICTSDPSEASFWNRVLPTLSNLRNLEVIASADRFDGVYPLTADASSEVLAKLLDWTSQKSHYKLHLHTLQVQGFDLTDAAETLRRHIHFPGLQVLGIQLCPNSVRLVEILYETHELGRLSLRTLILVEAEKSPESRLHNPALSRLLSTFGTLEHLFVRTKGSAAYWPDLPAVAGHAASLRLLHLDCLVPRSSGQQRRGSALQKLHKLEQFALPMSRIDLVAADCCATAPSYRELRGLLTCLNALPSLRTLQMLDMRLYDAEVVQNDQNFVRGFLLRHTRTLADYVFSAVAHLKAFSFERFNYRHTNKNYWESCSGRCYHRGRIIDALGREQTTAIEASLQELKQIEPAVDILDMEDLEHGGLFRYGYEL